MRMSDWSSDVCSAGLRSGKQVKPSPLQGRGLGEGESCTWPLSTSASEQARKPAYLSPEGERARLSFEPDPINKKGHRVQRPLWLSLSAAQSKSALPLAGLRGGAAAVRRSASAERLIELISSGVSSSSTTTFCRLPTSESWISRGRTVCSAISRSATTGFLSRSRSIVSSEPPEISRARCAESRTRSKRLETLRSEEHTLNSSH